MPLGPKGSLEQLTTICHTSLKHASSGINGLRGLVRRAEYTNDWYLFVAPGFLLLPMANILYLALSDTYVSMNINIYARYFIMELTDFEQKQTILA